MTAWAVLVTGAVLFYAAAATLLSINLFLRHRVASDRSASDDAGPRQSEHTRAREFSPDRHYDTRDRLDVAIICVVLATVFAAAAAGL